MEQENKAVENGKGIKAVTLEQLIKKKLEKDGKLNATKEIFVESLGANIVVKNPTDEQRVKWQDMGKSGSYVDVFEGFKCAVYDCCPMLHSKELQDEIGVVYPYDTVLAIFDAEEVVEIGTKIINFFEDDKTEQNPDEKIKN